MRKLRTVIQEEDGQKQDVPEPQKEKNQLRNTEQATRKPPTLYQQIKVKFFNIIYSEPES